MRSSQWFRVNCFPNRVCRNMCPVGIIRLVSCTRCNPTLSEKVDIGGALALGAVHPVERAVVLLGVGCAVYVQWFQSEKSQIGASISPVRCCFALTSRSTCLLVQCSSTQSTCLAEFMCWLMSFGSVQIEQSYLEEVQLELLEGSPCPGKFFLGDF